MGLLDDVLGSAVPGGNVAKPLIIGLAALLGAKAVGSGLGSLLGGTGASPQTPSANITRSAAGRTFWRPQRLVAKLSARRSR